jgi:hypothetical protein
VVAAGFLNVYNYDSAVISLMAVKDPLALRSSPGNCAVVVSLFSSHSLKLMWVCVVVSVGEVVGQACAGLDDHTN